MTTHVRYSKDYARALVIISAGGSRRLQCGCVIRVREQPWPDGPYTFGFAAQCQEAERIERLWPGERYAEERAWSLQDHVCTHVTPWYAAWET